MNSGAKIKFIREHYQLSPEQMSEKLNISVPTYRRLESGVRPPKVDELKFLSEEFDIDLQYFLNDNDSVFKNIPIRLISKTATIDKNLLESLVKSLKALVNILDHK